VKLTNLDKLFWPKLGITKRDLIQYYINIAPALLPHLKDRAMVMKRYPNGAGRLLLHETRSFAPSELD
jgi:bifunctional non-homologous end joining protein LigD